MICWHVVGFVRRIYLFWVFILFLLIVNFTSKTEVIAGQSGNFSNIFHGTGVIIEKKSDGYYVKGIIKKSPSDGKLQIGDLIKKIDDESAYEMTIEEITAKLEQLPGKEINFKIQRAGTIQNIVITTASFEINMDSIPFLEMPKYRISGFSQGNLLMVDFDEKPEFKKEMSFFCSDTGN